MWTVNGRNGRAPCTFLSCSTVMPAIISSRDPPSFGIPRLHAPKPVRLPRLPGALQTFVRPPVERRKPVGVHELCQARRLALHRQHGHPPAEVKRRVVPPPV